MSVPRTVADVIRQHVTLEVEGIDRMYLNVYQPKLQYDRGVVTFFRYHRKQPVVSSALMEPISTAFVKKIEAEGIKLDEPVRKNEAAGVVLTYITDPWGTRIELVQRPPSP